MPLGKHIHLRMVPLFYRIVYENLKILSKFLYLSLLCSVSLLVDGSAFVTAQYTGDTKKSKVSLCAGGITELFEGEVVYCAVSKSGTLAGGVDFGPYIGDKFNGVMTVTYLGQPN